MMAVIMEGLTPGLEHRLPPWAPRVPLGPPPQASRVPLVLLSFQISPAMLPYGRDAGARAEERAGGELSLVLKEKLLSLVLKEKALQLSVVLKGKQQPLSAMLKGKDQRLSVVLKKK